MKYLIASALGVPTGSGCMCALCGQSPFDSAGSAKNVISNGFADQSELHSHPDVCAGCKQCLGGKPGDDPPPLRTISFMVKDGSLSILDRPSMRQALLTLDADTISWSASRKKHHWMHAGAITKDLAILGSDTGPLEYRPGQHSGLFDIVERLIHGGFSRKSIMAGHWHPSTVVKMGVTTWGPLARSLSPYIGSTILELICWCAAKPEQEQEATEQDMIEEHTRMAANIVARLASSSSVRSNDGKMFWGGFLTHRINRFSRFPLEKFVARLMAEIHSAPHAESTRTLLAGLDELSSDETTAIERAFRDRASLVVAIAYDQMKKEREAS